jgi:L-alanine-DL-glutamate epimerase-like enolase superfamily enzyme
VPLDQPESDSTLAWNATIAVTVLAQAGGQTGLGWTYGPPAAGNVINDMLAGVVREVDASDVGHAHLAMRRATRNVPTPGLASLAISAVDVALWDLKAKVLNTSLTRLFNRVRPHVALYGSGGFTSMTEGQLREQLGGWVNRDGVTAVKIKVGEDRGANVARDLRRIRLARREIGDDIELMIDANGGYDTKQAVRVADATAEAVVSWFEEPVSSDRLEDLALLRGMLRADVTAGEYGTTTDYFRHMCQAGAVDCLQVDATRCGGYTGLLAAAAVADAYGLQISTHCAPHLHAPACAAVPNFRHAEYFADHVSADRLLFDGLPDVARGRLTPQDSEPGHGMRLRADADRLRVA